MKTQISTLVMLLLVFFSLNLTAERVEKDAAATVGTNYYWEKSQSLTFSSPDEVNLSLFSTKTFNGTPLYYIFNVNEKDGFVIVAADDEVIPILGYSLSGSWTGQNIPPALELLLNHYEEQIAVVIAEGLTGSRETTALWEQYLKGKPAPPKDRSVTPLLSAIWDQNQYYNEQCPVDLSGPGGHAYAGCVAVSMAQVMKYWQHPSQGTGSNSYVHPVYGTISANFGTATYNYASMPNQILSSNTEVARLLFHCGVAVYMNYGPTGSAPMGTNWDTDIENALKNNFGYSSTLQLKWKQNYSSATWISMLKTELNNGRPLIYYGWDGGNYAHNFNCDGYDASNNFHFNWGWSGMYNGYFALTYLCPHPNYNFTYMQAAIFDMYPEQSTNSYDFGDAPDPSYPTLLANSGACHQLSNPPVVYLGSGVDAEPDGQPDVNCNGDDNDILYPPANDDEDGVTIPALYQNNIANITVTASVNGYLNAWMDFNQDGDWADAGEQIFTMKGLSAGVNNLNVSIPSTAYTGWTYARFRFSTVAGLPFYGNAPDGEVEDYFIRILEDPGTGSNQGSLLFSVDIGSDTEMSDPQMDADEVFDPGDAYLFQGAFIPMPGTDGYIDDALGFGGDPFPDGGNPGTVAPCLSGMPIDMVAMDYFDMDGLDLAVCDLRDYPFGEGMPPVAKFDDAFIHAPDSLLISFDDDDAFPYTDPSGSIPMIGFSPTGMLYGQAAGKDEILEVNYNSSTPPPIPMTGMMPRYEESAIHTNLSPDPDFALPQPNDRDDDVDALDAPLNLEDATYKYFSADHEAHVGLNPGSIYVISSGIHEVINAQLHIGLPPGTDVDAFEFTWLYEQQHGYVALAMIFSVDDDDPTTAVDESGGLPCNKLFVTFMNGYYQDYFLEGFEDDIDAVAIFASGTPPPPPPVNSNFSPTDTLIYAGAAIPFTDLSTGNPTSWNWTFNGGNPASHNGQAPPPVVYSNSGNHQASLTVSNASSTDTKNGNIRVLPHIWQYNSTALSHNISIPLSANPMVNGSPLAANDVIGVFYTDFAGNENCGGWVIWDGVNNVSLSAFGDDPTTFNKEGFAEGEDFTWKVFSMNDNKAYQVVATYDMSMPDHDGKFHNNGMSALASLGSGSLHQFIKYQGWSGISTYLLPNDANPDSIFKDVMNDLVIMLGANGMYWPAQTINTIGNWNVYEGYKIKFSQDAVMNITGTPLTNRSVTLNPGWHILPVLSSGSVSAASILGVPGVDFAKEIAGTRVYWPGQSIYTLNQLFPGEAYVVHITATTTFSFPAKGGNSSFVALPDVESPWSDPVPTPNSHVIAISAESVMGWDKGDVIAAFNTEGMICGAAAITGDNLALTVYGDDPVTPDIDGMQESEAIIFRIFHRASGEITTLVPSWDPVMPEHDGLFAIDGLSRIVFNTGILSSAAVHISIYPNPAANSVNINTGDNTVASVQILNLLGEVVMDFRPAFRQMTLNVSSLPDGCYMVRLSDGLHSINKKLIIRK